MRDSRVVHQLLSKPPQWEGAFLFSTAYVYSASQAPLVKIEHPCRNPAATCILQRFLAVQVLCTTTIFCYLSQYETSVCDYHCRTPCTWDDRNAYPRHCGFDTLINVWTYGACAESSQGARAGARQREAGSRTFRARNDA